MNDIFALPQCINYNYPFSRYSNYHYNQNMAFDCYWSSVPTVYCYYYLFR